MPSARTVVLLSAGLCACASYRPESLRLLRGDKEVVAYRVSYMASFDPSPDIADFDVRVVRKGSVAHLDAVMDQFVAVRDRKPQYVSRDLTDAEWRSIAHCWDSESLLWSIHDHPEWEQYLDRAVGLGGSDGFRVEAVRGRQYQSVRSESSGDDALRECVRRMFHATGLHPRQAGWWWSEPSEPGPCTTTWDSSARIASVQWRGTHPPEVAGCPVEMVPIRGGTYPSLLQARRTVTVHPFCLDATPVTADEYAACIRAGSCSAAHLGERSADGVHFACDTACSSEYLDSMGCVDWAQAKAYCGAQGKRLPTEEEWEWAMVHVLTSPEMADPINSLAPVSRWPTEWGGWEWTASGADPETGVARGVLHGAVLEGIGRNDVQFRPVVDTERAEVSPAYRQPFLEFRCAREMGGQ